MNANDTTLMYEYHFNLHRRLSYWEANMESSRHPAQNGWIHILWPVCSSHHHHLQVKESQCDHAKITTYYHILTPETEHRQHADRYYSLHAEYDTLILFKYFPNYPAPTSMTQSSGYNQKIG